MRTAVSYPPPPQRGWGSIQGLWPTCKVAAARSRTHRRAHFRPEQRGQAGSTGHYATHLATPLRAALLCRPVPRKPQAPAWLGGQKRGAVINHKFVTPSHCGELHPWHITSLLRGLLILALSKPCPLLLCISVNTPLNCPLSGPSF